jgi:hypothetical protein
VGPETSDAWHWDEVPDRLKINIDELEDAPF